MWTGFSHLSLHRHQLEQCTRLYLTYLTTAASNAINIILLGSNSWSLQTINQYLPPIVKELLEFFTGVTMKVHSMNEPKTVGYLLLVIACHMPASRKACMWLPWPLCPYWDIPGVTRNFHVGVCSKDYSTFIEQILSTAPMSKRKLPHNDRMVGCRYSVLLEL